MLFENPSRDDDKGLPIESTGTLDEEDLYDGNVSVEVQILMERLSPLGCTLHLYERLQDNDGVMVATGDGKSVRIEVTPGAVSYLLWSLPNR